MRNFCLNSFYIILFLLYRLGKTTNNFVAIFEDLNKDCFACRNEKRELKFFLL